MATSLFRRQTSPEQTFMTHKSAKGTVDSAIRVALSRAIAQEGFAPLVTTPRSAEGLFGNRKSPNKKAIEVCLDPARPLLVARKVEETAEGSTKQAELVQINEKGITRLVQLTPVQAFPELIALASGAWKARVLNACLRAIVKRSNEPSNPSIGVAIQTCFSSVQNYLDDLTERLNQIVESQRAIAEAVLSFTNATAKTFAKQSKRLHDEGNLLAEARAQLVAPPSADAPPSNRRDIGWERLQIGRANDSEAAIDFQRGLSQELVFAWQDTTSPEARASLERATVQRWRREDR